MSGISTKASRFHSIVSEALANWCKFNGGNELEWETKIIIPFASKQE